MRNGAGAADAAAPVFFQTTFPRLYRIPVYSADMIRSFGDVKTERLFNDERVRGFEGFARRAKRKLESINAAVQLSDLMVPPSNRLEKLRGRLAGFHSIRIKAMARNLQVGC